VVEMQYGADLAEPLLEVRDVVETFRSYQITPPDWDESLRHATAALRRLQALAEVNVLPAGLVPDLDLLLADGLDSSPQIVAKVATQVAVVLAETMIPGPTSLDDDWSFGEASAS
jgi:hypothetical protein